MLKNALSVAALASTIVLISGCAGSVATQVKESDKDASFSFDGTYLATVNHPGGRQEMGNRWYNNCGAQKFTARFTVEQSEVTWSWGNGTTLDGFIDSDGRFRIESVLEDGITSSSTVMSDGTVTAILQGDIRDDKMVGRLVYGVAQFNGRGCTYPVKFEQS